MQIYIYKYIYTYNKYIYTNTSTHIINIYTISKYTNTIISPLHTRYPRHRGGGKTYLSTHLLYYYHLLHPILSSTQHTPTTGGERKKKMNTLTIFYHHLLYLVPPSTHHTPTTGWEGGTMTMGRGKGDWRDWHIYIHIF